MNEYLPDGILQTPKVFNLFIIMLARLNISISEPSASNSFVREIASRSCLALFNLLNSWILLCASLVCDAIVL